MSRFGGRFVPNIEHEVRRQAIEPVVKWQQEWVVPSGTSGDAASTSASANAGVKILKWVRVADSYATFPEEQDVQAEDRIADDRAIVEAPVQSIHNAPAVATPASSGLSVGGGLGTIAPKDPPSAAAVAPASAIPPHMTQNLSEPTSGVNTTGDNTPTDSVANTPAPADDGTATPAPATTASATHEVSHAPSSQGEPTTASGTGANTPQLQPQVEAQLHEQPTTAPTADTQTLAVLAGAAQVEHESQQPQKPTPEPEASAPTDDVDMNEA